MIVRIFFLDGIIRQVNFGLKNIDIELIWRSTDVALFVPISFFDAVEIRNEHIVSYVEFPIVIKKRAIDVHLHNKSFFGLFADNFSILVFFVASFGLLHDRVQLINFVNDSYTSALITVLSWLDYPNVPCLLWTLASFLFLLFFFSFYDSGSFFMIFYKLQILRILHSFSDVKSQRQIIVHIFFYQLVILLQVVK